MNEESLNKVGQKCPDCGGDIDSVNWTDLFIAINSGFVLFAGIVDAVVSLEPNHEDIYNLDPITDAAQERTKAKFEEFGLTYFEEQIEILLLSMDPDEIPRAMIDSFRFGLESTGARCMSCNSSI